MPTYRNGTCKYKHNVSRPSKSRVYLHSVEDYENRISAFNNSLLPKKKKTVTSKCGHCGKAGHNVRTCELKKQSQVINHFDKEYYMMVENLKSHPRTLLGYSRMLKFYRQKSLSTSPEPVAFIKSALRNSKIYQFNIIDPRLIKEKNITDCKEWKAKCARKLGDLVVEYYERKGIVIFK